ncbi:MAG: methyltransferase domain-containing protein [Anaerolineae bacterium]|nr:methyltransferase domain-containing protein [Anaerolineae bacterium]
MQPPPVCDYEGSSYRADFWGAGDRDYEDRVERIALRRLLPAGGRRMLEIGAGFGRLTGELAGYGEVVLHDYSRSMLREARARLGDSAPGCRYRYVASNVYSLPFAPGAFDGATMIRVIHHMADAPAALAQIRAALADGGVFILEFANKRNYKSIARYLLGRQAWSPFDPAPVEFVELNFDFHPDYMRRVSHSAGFDLRRQLTVSHFRIEWLKRLAPTGVLAALDSLAQLTGGWWQFTPSVFMQLQATGQAEPAAPLFKCPGCGSLDVIETPASVDCPACGTRYPIRDGVYDFKEPLAL